MMKYSSARLPTLILVSILALAVGCQQQLMPTPNLYLHSKPNPFSDVPAELRGSRVEVLYATDRAPVTDRNGALHYGHERSKSLAFGACTVEIGRNLSWDQLVQESTTSRRSRSLPLSVREIREIGRFPMVPSLAAMGEGQKVTPAMMAAEQEPAQRELISALAERLARTPRREAYVYVHGFANTFEDAAFVMAGVWHFMGRTGVPIIYTWPAGSPEGMLGGYTHDSESGQFTGYHLRQFLRAIAACPDLEKIHLIAHSRGTDVLVTALREINLQCTAAGKDTRRELKLGNVILAAADLDMEVTSQRIIAELLPFVPERMTVYVSATDRAIGVADVLFGSRRRIGQLRWSDLNEDQRAALKATSEMQVIDARVETGFLGHSYFHASPAVSSDLILILRDDRGPGAEHGRPLTRRQEGFWEIDDNYLRGQ